jgi:hypothetical protein
MVPVLFTFYGVPFATIPILFINMEALAQRDGQGRIISVYYAEVDNVNYYICQKIISEKINFYILFYKNFRAPHTTHTLRLAHFSRCSSWHFASQ